MAPVLACVLALASRFTSRFISSNSLPSPPLPSPLKGRNSKGIAVTVTKQRGEEKSRSSHSSLFEGRAGTPTHLPHREDNTVLTHKDVAHTNAYGMIRHSLAPVLGLCLPILWSRARYSRSRAAKG